MAIIELPEAVHGQTHLRIVALTVRGELGSLDREDFVEAQALRSYRLDLSPSDELGEIVAQALADATAEGEARERLMDGVRGRERTRDEEEPDPGDGEEPDPGDGEEGGEGGRER